jgi:hypothetical protein
LRDKAKAREYDRQYKKDHKEEIAAKRRAKALDNRKHADWKVIMDYVRAELKDFEALGIKPTLRAMHYRLYSKYSNVQGLSKQYHNTYKYYHHLSHYTTIAREGNHVEDYYGELDIDCFADDSRSAIYPSKTELNYEGPDEHIEKLIDKLKKLPETYAKDSTPRWINQPHYVEVWTEKKAMVATIQNIIGDREVAIVPLSGQPSVSFLWECCNGLRDYEELPYEYEDENGNTKTGVKTLHIIYLGDLDPSGEAIQDTVQEKIEQYGVPDVDWQLLGVTEQQMNDLKLPSHPSGETLAKLNRDRTRHRFKARHGGKLFQVEVDALMAYDAPGFRTMLQKAIDDKFNNDIYQKALVEYSSESIKENVNKSIRYEFNLRGWW